MRRAFIPPFVSTASCCAAAAAAAAAAPSLVAAPRHLNTVFKPVRTKYWAISECEYHPNAADVYIRRSLADVALAPELKEVLSVSHPTDIDCFEAVPFLVGNEDTLQEMANYYRRMLRNARPAKKLLADMNRDAANGPPPGMDTNVSHLNASRTLLSFVVANTASGPCLQRFILFNYGCDWNDVLSVESQFARRQIAAVWTTSLLGARTFVTKTNAIEHEGRSIITRRFLEGVDLPKFLEIEGEKSLADILGTCEDKEGVLKMTLIKTASSALDLHNPHNVLVPHDSEIHSIARVVSIDHELEFPSPSICHWYSQKNPYFEWDNCRVQTTEEGDWAPDSDGCNNVALPGSFAWRADQTQKLGQLAFARQQVEAGKAARYLDGQPWVNLLTISNKGNVDKTLQESLKPRIVRKMLSGLSTANRVMDLLDISKGSRASFDAYMEYARGFADRDQPMTLADIIAPKV